MDRDRDRDLERLRDLEADFVDFDITAASPPQTVTEKTCVSEFKNFRYQTVYEKAQRPFKVTDGKSRKSIKINIRMEERGIFLEIKSNRDEPSEMHL